MTNTSNVTNWYSANFKGWSEKQLGPKPTEQQLTAVHMLNCRPGKQALAIAMYLRDGGASQSQIVQVCGAPQLNKARDLATDNYLKRIPIAPDAKGHTVYKYEVTAKGLKRIEANEKRAADAAADAAAKADKPAKPVKKAKGKAKSKAAPKVTNAETAPTPTVDAAVPDAVNLPDVSPINADLNINT
jgi:hypothetical protein